MDNSEAAEEDPARGAGEGSGLSFPPVVEGIERGARGAISINAWLLSCGCRFTPRQPSVMTLTA